MDLITALAFAGAVFIFTFKPGPGMLAAVSRALVDGWMQGAAIIWGHCTMHMVYLTLVCMAFPIIQEKIVFLGILLKTLGAVLMIYLAIKELNKLHLPLTVSTSGKAHQRDLMANYMTGVMTGLANPLVILFYAAIIPAVINIPSMTLGDVVTSNLIVLTINAGGLTLLCMGADHVRQFFAHQDKARYVRILMAGMFILIGLVLGVSAMSFIDWQSIYFPQVAS